MTDTKTNIEEKLKTVYDPEFPMVDIYTLGLIYNVGLDQENKLIDILMTFTTPHCPMADMLKSMITNAVSEVVPEYNTVITVTFEPMRNISMIKDQDLQRMFE